MDTGSPQLLPAAERVSPQSAPYGIPQLHSQNSQSLLLISWLAHYKLLVDLSPRSTNGHFNLCKENSIVVIHSPCCHGLYVHRAIEQALCWLDKVDSQISGLNLWPLRGFSFTNVFTVTPEWVCDATAVHFHVKAGWALGLGLGRADALSERTTCGAAPGSPAPPRPAPRAPRPPPEPAVLRCVSAQVRRRHERLLAGYRGYRGNRVALVAQLEREILAQPQALSWGRVAALLTFAGTPGAGRGGGQGGPGLPAPGGLPLPPAHRPAPRLAGGARRLGWLLSLLHTHAAIFLEKTTGQGSSVMLCHNDLNLLLEKIIMSSKIINPFLPACDQPTGFEM
ncbi:bcl-2-like protein 10 [Vulpes vulpes]|uniref:Bcl-2-like protein 10 n=1 Tax=Vulpes vulpes TaxID=9627 RepID=A0ABM4YVB2_VULVU